MTKSKKYSISICNNSYYELEIFENCEITITDIKAIATIMEQKYDKLKLPVLVLCNEFALVNNEAMKYLAISENFPYSKSGAYVVSSIAQKILANFYLKINKPQRPTKFFNNKPDAIEWLQQYI